LEVRLYGRFRKTALNNGIRTLEWDDSQHQRRPADPAFWRAQAAAKRSLAEMTNDTYLKGVLLRRADEYMSLAEKAEARLMLSR
jgi:hypothetical protein